MRVLSIAILSLAAAAAVGPGQAFGQTHADNDRGAVLEIGAAGEWGLGDGKSSLGPNVALEVTPIEHWLEIEMGLTPLLSKGSAELDADVVFKKPFQLSKTVEFMIGIGPEWVTPANSLGAVAVLDFMFWPTPRYGWFVEPSYSYAFDSGHDKNLAVSVGLLIALSP
ncbi:MAG: hypothetical protein ACLPKB_15815 [Xanthobacteraceae bacterium]